MKNNIDKFDDPKFRESKRHMFDAYCKIVLRNEARDTYAQKRRHAAKELYFSDLSPAHLYGIASTDDYFQFEDVINARGLDFVVCDEELYEALLQLPPGRLDIVLMSYYLQLSDRQIGLQLGMSRANVQYHRSRALRQLREIIEYERGEL